MIRRLSVYRIDDPHGIDPKRGKLIVTWRMNRDNAVMEDAREQGLADALRESVKMENEEDPDFMRPATLADGQEFLRRASEALPYTASRFMYEVEEG